MAINKDPSDSRTYIHEALVVDPSTSGVVPPDWPGVPVDDIDYAIMFVGRIIAYGNYSFQTETKVSGAGGPWGVETKKYQPGIFLKRLEVDGPSPGITYCKARVTAP